MKNLTLQENIPKEWQQVRLGDVCDIKKGEQLNRLDMVTGAEYPALNGGINPSGHTHSWNAESNTITISEGGNSCGYVNFMTTRFWCGGHCYVIKDVKKHVVVDFLYQLLKSKQDELMKLRVGSGLPNIQKKSIENFSLIIPSIFEQKKIAEILTSVDDEIRKTDEIIFQTEKLKKGLMQNLFTKGIGHKKFKKTKIGEVPEDWDVAAIKDAPFKLIDGDRGVNYPKLSDFTSGGYCLFLNNKNIKNDQFVFSDIQFVSREKDELLRKGKLERLDVVLTTRGTVGNVAFYGNNITFENIRINSGMILLRACEELNPDFLYHLMKSPFMKKRYEDMVSGSAQPQLPIRSLEQIYIPIPPEDEQEKIVEISQAIDEKITINNCHKEVLTKLKNGLAQDLLSGKVRTIKV
jgi:type I restriction enzyme S subunit